VNIVIRKYTEKDLKEMIKIWNEVVGEGIAFPQEDFLSDTSGKSFFGGQTYCAVAENTKNGKIYGLYILHPNNIGRCGHICNASYAVSSNSRGLHIGEKLVNDSLQQAKVHGFEVLQFNAVVESNIHARHLYERLGFVQLGTIPNGFRTKDGHYENICPYYREL
jgi:L-amino acid N-acyltransferase YncA